MPQEPGGRRDRSEFGYLVVATSHCAGNEVPMTSSLVLRPLAILGLTMLVPQGTPATGDAPEDTLFVTCREGSGHTVRGPLVSSSSGYRAYVTVTAEMRRLEGWPTCVNTASLFVASPGAGSFSMVFQKEPTPERSGNGLRLVDWWGPDGRCLIVVAGRLRRGRTRHFDLPSRNKAGR